MLLKISNKLLCLYFNVSDFWNFVMVILVFFHQVVQREYPIFYALLVLGVYFGLTLSFIYKNYHAKNLDIEEVTKLTFFYIFLILFLADYFTFRDIEIIFFSIVTLSFIIFSLTKPWLNNGCNELIYIENNSIEGIIDKLITRFSFINKFFVVVFKYFNKFAFICTILLFGLFLFKNPYLRLICFWFLIDFIIYYKFLEFIIKRSKILSILATKYQFCCNYSKFMQKTFGMMVVYEGSNLYLCSREQTGLIEVIQRSHPQDLKKNMETYEKVIKERNFDKVSVRTLPEKALDAYKDWKKNQPKSK